MQIGDGAAAIDRPPAFSFSFDFEDSAAPSSRAASFHAVVSDSKAWSATSGLRDLRNVLSVSMRSPWNLWKRLSTFARGGDVSLFGERSSRDPKAAFDTFRKRTHLPYTT